MRPTAVALVALLVAGCSATTPTPAATTQAPTNRPSPTTPAFTSADNLTLRPAGTVDGASLGYIEYVPPGTGGVEMPLLVFLHGSSESGDGDVNLESLYATGIPRVIQTNAWPENRPFIVLMPQFGPTSSQCTDPVLIDEFLEFAINHYPVDPSRVYLTGLSCGAFGAWDYLGEHTDELVAAAVLIAGDGTGAIEKAGCDLGRVPIWAIHGGNDRAVDVSGSEIPIAALNACTDPAPVDARINVYAGVGHAIWQPFYDGTKRDVDIYAWMLGYTNPTD